MPTFCRTLQSTSPHQSEEQPDTELFLRAIPFYTTCVLRLLVGVEEKRISGGGGEGEVGEIVQFSITERMIFHILFML